MNEMKEILLPGEPDLIEDEVPLVATLLFAPIDKRAFGVAIAAVSMLLLSLVTLVELILEPEPSVNLALLSQYFAGYSVTWPGLLIGAAWAFGIGFAVGWLTAFLRNLVLAVSLFLLRSRAELSESRDFLDHI